MTLGIDSVTSPTGRSDDDYLKWAMPVWSSAVLDDGTKSYYLYAKVQSNSTMGTYILSERSIPMESESGYYYLLVGVLNREYEGTREFVTLYGFTEVLPGQITTDVIKSADGNAVLDLARGMFTFGLKVGLSGAKESDLNLRMWAGSGEGDKEEAPYRVYEDGSVYASRMNLLKGCKIGEDMLLGDEDGAGYIRFGKILDTDDYLGISEGVILAHSKSSKGKRQCLSFSGCSGYAMMISVGGNGFYCTNRDSDVGLEIDAPNAWAHCVPRGVFAGLRSKTRVISMGDESGTSSSPVYLDEFDYNVLITRTTGTVYLSLPDSPLDGQEYWLETFGADVIMSSSVRMWSHTKGAYETTHTFSARGVVRFKYYAAASTWTYSWVESL